MKSPRAKRSSLGAAVFLTAAALAGALPAAPGCTVFAGWSDLQNGRSGDAAAPGATSTIPTGTGTPVPPDASTSGGEGAPTNLPPCPFNAESSCACSGSCRADCVAAPGCQFVVENGSVGNLDCTAGKCTYWCLGGICGGDCTGGGCVVHCRTGAMCNFDCTGGGCVFACEGGTCNDICTGGGCESP